MNYRKNVSRSTVPTAEVHGVEAGVEAGVGRGDWLQERGLPNRIGSMWFSRSTYRTAFGGSATWLSKGPTPARSESLSS
jgi:hypothetical protein